MPAIDSNVVNIGLPTIAAELHTDFSSVQWVVISYLLAVTSLSVGVGRIGDIFGKKRIYLVGLAIFTAASLLCGLADSIPALIAFRAVQGIGGSVMMALSFAIAGDLVPSDRLIRSMAVLTAMIPIGFALGPPLGGFLLHFFGWRSLFFFNLPLGLAALFLAFKFPALTAGGEPQKLDLPGMLLLTGTLVCYVLGITSAEHHGFGQATVLLFALAAAGLVSFLFIEKRTRFPIVSFSVFKNITFSASLVISVLMYTVVSGISLILPFYLQQAQGYSTFASGLLMTCGPAGCAICTPISGAAARRFGNFMVMKLGILSFALGAFALSFLTISTGPLTFAPILFWFNASLAFFQTPNNTSAISMARPEQRGVASGLLNLSRMAGHTTGASLIGAVFYFFVKAPSVSDLDAAAIVSGVNRTFLIAACIAAAASLVGFFMLTPKKAGQTDQ